MAEKRTSVAKKITEKKIKTASKTVEKKSTSASKTSSGSINKKRIFVLDTNVLLHDSNSIYSFLGSVVVIPLAVLEELDQFKSEKTELGRNARQISRNLDEMRQQGSLADGVLIKRGKESILVKVMPILVEMERESFDLPLDLLDHRIIFLAKSLADQGNHVTLVSKDINVRLKSDALGVEVEDYRKGIIQTDEYYKGWHEVIVDRADLKKINKDNMSKMLDIATVNPNQFVLFTDEHGSDSYRLFRNKTKGELFEVRRSQGLWSFRDKNVQQLMALDLLLDDTVQIVSLLGPAGTGKTFLALLAGLDKVLQQHQYRKLLVARPIVSLGADIGFLPGDVQEKLYEWMHPVYDNLEYIFNEMYIRGEVPNILKNKQERKYEKERCGKSGKHKKQSSGYKKREEEGSHSYGARVHGGVLKLQTEGLLALEAITYMRGRSIPNQFMFIDEVQNLTPHEVKTIVSRAGDGTKVILGGDPYQIDSPYLDFSSNGLTITSEKLKNENLAGSVFLERSERSSLAKLAVEKL
ncbi:PhoH family protein [Candidatus Babeliales bacterium]|nr:PhoH family protein [Candidatus Babeliales bacterium]